MDYLLLEKKYTTQILQRCANRNGADIREFLERIDKAKDVGEIHDVVGDIDRQGIVDLRDLIDNAPPYPVPDKTKD